MRLDHLLSRENTLEAKATNGLPRSSVGNDVRKKVVKTKGREAKDTDWAESHRCIVLKDRREELERATQEETFNAP